MTDQNTTDNKLNQQSLIQHLMELRTCILRALLGVFVIFFCLIWFRNDIYTFIAQPLINALPAGSKLIATELISPFIVPIKLTLWLSFFLAVPWVVYQIWRFIAPGLYQKEKRLVFPLLASSILLFYTGMLFSYYAVMPLMVKFLVGTTPDGVEMATDIGQYLSVVLRLFFIFGVAFEVPVAIILLVLMDVISAKDIKAKRPYIIIGAFVVAAVVTPPDVLSQVAFAGVTILLFELGLWIASRLKRSE
ncbi:twin-arginine translocase subunit TatC [Wohlfahrtiimonas chitiniclastica]|uniref:twin-arginine translocase subunit TatC n=1 Tax=Wohlfahrtiimonas chitiniclastica TaxID=400946 RepID=UPI001BD18EEA|nr:twin-arginine translocase subunit TatC [Wohlfahrtiimonas chitiniclastica]MBS7838803.1 twin-arginine translocase subunit TatC [Wohlfahrtiimonas chitiniclastica]